MWAGVYAPPAADGAPEHLEKLISNMSSDKMPAWCMQAMQSADVIALIKGETKEKEARADQRPVQVPNTLSKVGDKAMIRVF